MTDPKPRSKTETESIVAEILWDVVYGRQKKDSARALSQAHKVTLALGREGLLAGVTPTSGAEALAWAAKQRHLGKAPQRGISHLAAEAIVLLGLPQVHRHIVTALIPGLDQRGSDSVLSLQFKRALRRFRYWDWIDLSEGTLISVNDRGALTEWFLLGEDGNAWHARTTLDVASAAAAATVESKDSDEVRLAELRRLRALMESAPGSTSNPRGAVRVVPHSDPLDVERAR